MWCWGRPATTTFGLATRIAGSTHKRSSYSFGSRRRARVHPALCNARVNALDLFWILCVVLHRMVGACLVPHGHIRPRLRWKLTVLRCALIQILLKALWTVQQDSVVKAICGEGSPMCDSETMSFRCCNSSQKGAKDEDEHTS